MADNDHPKSGKSQKRHSTSSAPAEDVRSHRMSTVELPAESEVKSARGSRASEPGPITTPLIAANGTESAEKPPSVIETIEEEATPEIKSPGARSGVAPPKSPGARSAASGPKSPAAHSVVSGAAAPKSPAAQSVKTMPKSPGKLSTASQPKSPEAQSVKTQPKSPGKQSVTALPKSPARQSVTAPPKSPGRQSVTAPPKSPGRQSVTTPKSPGIQSAASPPKSPGLQSTESPPGTTVAEAPSVVPPPAPPPSLVSAPVAPPSVEAAPAKPPSVVAASVATPAPSVAAPSAPSPPKAPSVVAQPLSPRRPSVITPPKSPAAQSSAAPPMSPAVQQSLEPSSVAAPTELVLTQPDAQPQPVTTESPVEQQIVTSAPPSEAAQIPAAAETSEYAGSQIVPAPEQAPAGEEPEESQEVEKEELIVKDILHEITGLESTSFQGYMGSLGDFLCTHCKIAVYTLWKTPCNHQFCEKCKAEATSDELLTCSVEGTQINISELEEITSDLDKLKEAEVFCLNKAQGCKEKYPIKDIKDHLENCYYTFFPCPQNCGLTVIRKELGRHLTDECERRVYLCDMCETDVQEVERTVHDEVCEKKPPPTNCEFCGLGPIERADMEGHYLDCVQKPRPCRMCSIGCTFVGTKEEADCHENFDNHRELIMAFIQEQKETVMNLEQEKNETKLQLSEALGKLQNIDLINRYLAVKVGILEEVPYVQKEMEEENKFLKRKVEDLLSKQLTHEEQICRMTEYCAGRPFEWIINDYSKKKEMEREDGGRQCSPPFYISYSGYRVRLVAYLNGNGEGKGSHLAVYYCVMKGANDAVLDWPFKQKVTLRLVDRKFGTPLLKKVVEPKSFTLGDDSFQRPVFEENVGRGYPKFISHEELEAIDSRYLLKDSIIIAAEFEPAEITE